MRALSLLALLATLLTGCETAPKGPPPEPTYEQAVQGKQFSTLNYNAVAELIRQYGEPDVASNHAVGTAPFIVATVVNIDQLEQSSTLGRLISEQVSSRLTQMGHRVVELKVRNGVYMKRNEGEFMLTREIKEVANTHRAQAVVIGTYAESASLIYVSLKLVNPANSVILAAHDYVLPLDRQVRSLMRRSPAYGQP